MRLTGKNKNGRYGFVTERNTLGIFDENSLADKCYTKLGQLEDIEDELGIDLITLFSAFKNGIWIKQEDSIFKHKPYNGGIVEGLSYFRRLVEPDWIEKYGKIWALTKEELE